MKSLYYIFKKKSSLQLIFELYRDFNFLKRGKDLTIFIR